MSAVRPPLSAGLDTSLDLSAGAGLPDLNVLLAAAWPNHIHHHMARRWFTENAGKGWATCPFTQAGFVRLSSNPRVVDGAVSPRDALALLQRMTRVGRHLFWPDDLDLTVDQGTLIDRAMGHRQITDAYLLALALRHEGRLITLDRSIPDLLPPASPERDLIEIIRSS